ncbi:sensor histidine kinase KdpD [Azospirillum sp. TSH100]|uniref:sensor histidine kinase n=1 Tax=Azospirillum sp. TSH100 TaxID=652764 RepID=UPI001304FC80|nr:HAMP domain-containing sensor histidine kinase [Azospirillum sp. TSH100]
MPSLSATMPDLPELALLAGLSTPLWLARAEDGVVVWLNGAARALLDPDAEGGLRIAGVGRGPADAIGRTVTIRAAGGTSITPTVRIGPVAGHDLLLVEAPADSAARRETARLNEQRLALSGDGDGMLHADIADLKAQALELAAVNRRKSDYVHHLSHELRTPLTAVIGFAEILRDRLLGPPDSPRYGEAAAQIVAAGDYMLELINNLLDLARIEAGGLELHEEDCLPALIVEATLSMMAARAGRSGVTLTARLPDDLPALWADPSLVRQMLTNLVGNALKFTAAGGHVMVSAERDGEGGLALVVADDGCGMPPDRIPQALTAFAQLHDPARDPMTAAEHGSGLGLPLTAALVELHGGGIAIDSAPGRGTTVRLRFPPERVVG